MSGQRRPVRNFLIVMAALVVLVPPAIVAYAWFDNDRAQETRDAAFEAAEQAEENARDIAANCAATNRLRGDIRAFFTDDDVRDVVPPPLAAKAEELFADELSCRPLTRSRPALASAA